VSARDAERFRALYQSEVIALLGYAARRVDRPEDAADVVADVFTAVWRRIDEVPAGGDARPWLFGVARNVVANHRRGARRRDRLTDRLRGELRLMTTSTPTSTTTSTSTSTEDVDEVRQALGRLTCDDRELLLLTNWEALSPTEVAIAMGLPAGTIRSRLHRARQRLRRELGALGELSVPANGIERCPEAGHVHTNGRSLAAEHDEELR
jgi:RNA polymerase sigma-70 factor (ECF subfamily)